MGIKNGITYDNKRISLQKDIIIMKLHASSIIASKYFKPKNSDYK